MFLLIFLFPILDLSCFCHKNVCMVLVSVMSNWLQHVTPASKNIFKMSSRAEFVMVDPHIQSFSRLLAISSQASPSRRRSSQAPPFSLSKVCRKQNLCKGMKIRGWEEWLYLVWKSFRDGPGPILWQSSFQRKAWNQWMLLYNLLWHRLCIWKTVGLKQGAKIDSLS